MATTFVVGGTIKATGWGYAVEKIQRELVRLPGTNQVLFEGAAPHGDVVNVEFTVKTRSNDLEKVFARVRPVLAANGVWQPFIERPGNRAPFLVV